MWTISPWGLFFKTKKQHDKNNTKNHQADASLMETNKERKKHETPKKQKNAKSHRKMKRHDKRPEAQNARQH